MKQSNTGYLTCIVSLSILFASGFTASQADSHDVFGVFLTKDKDSHISVSDCGDGTPCGRVVWIAANALNPGDTAETLKTKDGRIVLGLEIFNGYRRHSKDWRGGKLYDPKTNRTFVSRLKRLQDGTLEVNGCIGSFCQTQIWPEVALAVEDEDMTSSEVAKSKLAITESSPAEPTRSELVGGVEDNDQTATD